MKKQNKQLKPEKPYKNKEIDNIIKYRKNILKKIFKKILKNKKNDE